MQKILQILPKILKILGYVSLGLILLFSGLIWFHRAGPIRKIEDKYERKHNIRS